MRLDKFLADCGLGTRSDVKKLIKSGAVSVLNFSGKLTPETKIDENNDAVFIGGKKIFYRKYIYLMMNKPAGYISAVYDKRQPVVLDLVPREYLHFEPYPLGRLDIDTEGLLILTNDGELTHRLLSPKSGVPKTYYAEVDGAVTEADVSAFKAGITLRDGTKTLPAELKILSSSQEDGKSRTELTITEGKFHQVKRMFEASGKKVTYLKRLQMNGLRLDETLKAGEVRELCEDELALLTDGIKSGIKDDIKEDGE